MHPSSFLPPLKFILIPIAILFIIAIAKLALSKLSGAKFKLKTPLLSAPEQDLYRRLVAALPDNVVLAQVAFSQMISVAGGNSDENFRKRLTAQQKVADFVICDKSFAVVAVIELDDSSHSREKDEKRDAIITEAGSKTIRWRVSRLPTTEEIRRQILGA
jgi:very-short-patch-repair endonuclease